MNEATKQEAPVGSIAWVLECGCEPDVEHCDQCDERRRWRNVFRLEAAVENACQAIYREFEGYWPSDFERARIAVALLGAEGRWL